ncbi:hypothetical protein [Photobacterium leiognathi]|uniref:hypothetical protein n=1 Tax=Photobacterium leiognathi TaxID=553611 RepID=UPI002981B99B|nr:hypothetical protein [Photobacterium leiognathi]
MSHCDHIVAVCGKIFIKSSKFNEESKVWVESVRRFNDTTDRLAIQPPVDFTTVAYCCNCGEKLDKEAHEKIIKKHFADAYDLESEPLH